MTQQLTFQGFLDALAAVPQDATVKVAGFGSADTPGVLFRHRPFVDGLAITPTITRPALQTTTAEYADFLRRTGPGLTWSQPGHAGFEDQYPSGSGTAMWAGTPYNVSFNAVTGVEMVKGFAVIRTANLAPVQGPSIQRIPDEEVIRRMRVADVSLHGEAKEFPPKVEQFLIKYIAKDRSTVLQRLAEAREDLENFEASRQAKRDMVVKLQNDAARHDYFLGISDEHPE